MRKFHVVAPYEPSGDQPQAIEKLAAGFIAGDRYQTLKGVTGSGKTFTMAKIIEKVQRPTLVISHNKTLSAQLYKEFKSFFPDNAVEYFVSYYDYYQPEAYIPSSGKYIEKSLDINDEIDRLRLSALSALLSGRNDVIVVSSVSCIYGMGNPGAFYDTVIELKQGMKLERDMLLRKLVSSLYTRNDIDVKRGEFRVKGDTVDIALAYSENLLRVTFWDNEVDTIEEVEPLTMHVLSKFDEYKVYPANLFVTTQEQQEGAIKNIQDDLTRQIDYFNEIGKPLEAERIKERTEYDMEMIKEVGYCSGIENYSRYFDGREPGTRPYCLLDFFPKDYLMVIDESHVSVPQINAMYGGDRARKTNLVEYGFRLPAAFDNRPLKFEEFEQLTNQVVYISATPADYELQQAEGVVVEQLIRPTGLLDPEIEVRPSDNQVDDLMDEINSRCKKDERVLVTTLTKRMAEELTQYLLDNGVSATYIHSDVILEDRVKILENLRNGTFDVLVGVNLLREGLDLPEVSLVAILDADKEGFLRSNRSLTQTAGRAARNVNGKVIFYANTITKSMQQTMDETSRRREKQLKYNEENHITPTQIKKALKQSTLIKSTSAGTDTVTQKPYIGRHEEGTMVADPITERMTADQLKKSINHTEEMMKAAAKQLDFLQAAQYRDELIALQDRLQNMTR